MLREKVIKMDKLATLYTVYKGPEAVKGKYGPSNPEKTAGETPFRHGTPLGPGAEIGPPGGKTSDCIAFCRASSSSAVESPRGMVRTWPE